MIEMYSTLWKVESIIQAKYIVLSGATNMKPLTAQQILSGHDHQQVAMHGMDLCRCWKYGVFTY